MINPLIFILISLGLAYFLAEIVKKLGLPRVVGQISAGLILGIPLIRKYLSATDNLEILSFLANLGIVLLFYYVGLETDFRTVTKNIQQSVLISLFKIINIECIVFTFFIC